MRKYATLISAVLIAVLFTLFPDPGVDRDKVSISFSKSGLFISSPTGGKHYKGNSPSDFKIPDADLHIFNSLLDEIKYGKSAERLVVIDAGHGGGDPGTESGKLLEKDIALDVALKLQSILKSAGINTYLIREDDRYIDYKERIYTANRMQAALFLSIHCDWFKDSSYSGTTTLYYPSKSLSMSKLTELEYARTVQGELAKMLETKDRGIIDRTELSVLKHAEMPSVIVELGFLSNKNDESLLSSGVFRQKAAEALAVGIVKSLSYID
jgi:N-acetylmuramoyl-L-alanine amidase